MRETIPPTPSAPAPITPPSAAPFNASPGLPPPASSVTPAATPVLAAPPTPEAATRATPAGEARRWPRPQQRGGSHLERGAGRPGHASEQRCLGHVAPAPAHRRRHRRRAYRLRSHHDRRAAGHGRRTRRQANRTSNGGGATRHKARHRGCRSRGGDRARHRHGGPAHRHDRPGALAPVEGAAVRVNARSRGQGPLQPVLGLHRTGYLQVQRAAQRLGHLLAGIHHPVLEASPKLPGLVQHVPTRRWAPGPSHGAQPARQPRTMLRRCRMGPLSKQVAQVDLGPPC